MLKNENIICISSIDWDFIWQSHQQIMSTLAKNGNRILFIENTGIRMVTFSDMPRLKKRIINWLKSTKGYRKEAENLYTYSPIILPFPYLKIALWINKYLLFTSLKRWSKITNFNNPIIWTYLPTPITLSLIEEFPYKALIYYLADNLAATSKLAKRITKYEERVLRKADVVFAMPKNMLEYCRRFNKNVLHVPMGVDIAKFLRCEEIDKKPPEIENINNRIIGYVGGLRSSVDQELIAFLASYFSDFMFFFIGPIQTDISLIKKFKNLIFVRQKSHEELPRYIKYFDVGIIVYRKDDYGDNISSGKLNEYSIMGKPVVSTRIKEVENFNKESDNIIYIADSYQDFADLILKAITEDNEILRNKRREIACNNSWDKKIELMSEFIKTTIEKQEKKDLNWQENLLKIYKNVKDRITHTALVLSIIWFIIFYTPLVWFLAEPLRISEPTRKADCIVVFAGGVGESGRPGQGYEERVEYAVRLYKQGIASHMIFSSGYVYVFKEPLVMKALAVQLGVPEGDILLEDKAGSTYQNVKFTKEVLDKNNWKDILLISASYHMRRASLVFNKIANGINVTFAPLPYSSFYAHSDKTDDGKRIWKRVNLKQIKGILHEYLGILYYWWKGWI